MKPSSSLVTLLKILIGLVLAVTAVGKLLDNRGFATVLQTYQTFPEGSLLGLGLCISLAELGLAVWLFSGRYLRLAALTALLMHLTYAIWSAVSVLRDLKISNCGCFGVFWARPLGWSTVVEDLVMTALCLVLYLAAGLKAPSSGRLTSSHRE